MGTDIHCFAERRSAAGWEPCYDLNSTTDEERSFLPFYCGQERNYELFALLAGVRRLTNEGFQPIAPVRGLPEDLSPAVREVALSQDGMWGHNHTWLSLQELLAYPWQETKRTVRVHVDAAGFCQFRDQGRPNRGFSFLCEGSLCATGSGTWRKPVLISNEEMERLIREGQETEAKFTEVIFEEPVASYCYYFLSETLPLLSSLASPEDVRIILWFDS
jgi:hypothetical protein